MREKNHILNILNQKSLRPKKERKRTTLVIIRFASLFGADRNVKGDHVVALYGHNDVLIGEQCSILAQEFF